MILVIDIGNTNTVLGVFEGKELMAEWRLATDRQKTADEYGVLVYNLFSYQNLDMRKITDIAISSVVPPVNPVFVSMCTKYFGIDPLVVGPGHKTGMVIRYENPKEVGADRIINAIAAYDRYKCPLIIVDFGTATTFCAVSGNGDYLGGVIAPGIGISAEALFQRAAKLPRVELVKPKTVIGKTTVASMQAGIIFGFAGQVNEIVRRMKAEMASEGHGDPKVVATGGLASLIAPEASEIEEVDPHLTLHGLRLFLERNRS